nr:protein STRUBBELIG-receptor family 2 [Tanacetum cinerariifolium]
MQISFVEDVGRPSLLTLGLFRPVHDNESLDEMVEPALTKTILAKALSRFADIVSLCIQAEKGFRPPISEILESPTNMIEGYRKMRTPTGASFPF